MSDKPEDSPKKEKPKDDDKQKLPPVTPSISGSETSPEMSRNVDDLRNRSDLLTWFDSDDETKPQPKRRTVKPNYYNRRRITKPGTDIKKELEELASEIHGRWQLEPSPLNIAAEQKEEPNRIGKRIVPFDPDRSISPSRSLDYSSSSLTPTTPRSLSPKFTPRYGPLFDTSDILPEISFRVYGNSSLTIRNALTLCIILFCLSLIILAFAVYKLKFS